MYVIDLDPTISSKIKKTRPCTIVSPNEMNHNINTVIIAPMSTKGKKYPTRIEVVFAEKSGWVLLDQIRTVDKKRLLEKKGQLKEEYCQQILQVLAEMFAN